MKKLYLTLLVALTCVASSARAQDIRFFVNSVTHSATLAGCGEFCGGQVVQGHKSKHDHKAKQDRKTKQA